VGYVAPRAAVVAPGVTVAPRAVSVPHTTATPYVRSAPHASFGGFHGGGFRGHR
jgi:hypothetical protein